VDALKCPALPYALEELFSYFWSHNVG
jgi:hypothetical protein